MCTGISSMQAHVRHVNTSAGFIIGVEEGSEHTLALSLPTFVSWPHFSADQPCCCTVSLISCPCSSSLI